MARWPQQQYYDGHHRSGYPAHGAEPPTCWSTCAASGGSPTGSPRQAGERRAGRARYLPRGRTIGTCSSPHSANPRRTVAAARCAFARRRFRPSTYSALIPAGTSSAAARSRANTTKPHCRPVSFTLCGRPAQRADHCETPSGSRGQSGICSQPARRTLWPNSLRSAQYGSRVGSPQSSSPHPCWDSRSSSSSMVASITSQSPRSITTKYSVASAGSATPQLFAPRPDKNTETSKRASPSEAPGRLSTTRPPGRTRSAEHGFNAMPRKEGIPARVNATLPGAHLPHFARHSVTAR